MGGITLEDFSQSNAYQEIFGSGEARGEAREAAKVTLRLLARIQALLDFSGPDELTTWLAANA